MQKIKKEPKVSASSVNVSPGVQLDEALTSMGALIDAKANISDVEAVTGSRSNLNTTDKTNLVAAINEAYATVTDYDSLNNKPLIRENGGYKINFSGAEANAARAISLGMGAIADATGSLAEGEQSWAIGNNSHAEGYETITAGSYSHAEGNNTVAYGSYSHAEGNVGTVSATTTRAYTANSTTIYTYSPLAIGTVISDDWESVRAVTACTEDTTEGDWALTLDSGFDHNIASGTSLSGMKSAYGSSSHTEGSDSLAYGQMSHAEGSNSSAIGAQSHAEGLGCVANGNNSHAEGTYTETTNQGEHASGEFNKSTSGTKFSVGIGTSLARKNAFEITANGDVYIKGIGDYDGTNRGSSGIQSLQEVIEEGGGGTSDYNSLSNVPIINTSGGGYRTADATSATSGAFAEGDTTTASGLCSHAEGNNTVAYGSHTHAEGYYTKASTENSHAEGKRTLAQGSGAHAEGENTHTLGDSSHAEGCGTRTGRTFTVKSAYTAGSTTIWLSGEPSLTKPLLYYSESRNVVDATYIEEYEQWQVTLESGFSVNINVDESVSETGDYSHAEGYETEVIGRASHAEGCSTHASADYSHAEGYTTTASGDYSHTEGRSTNTEGDYSHAEGYTTKASGDYSHTEGIATRTTNEGEHAEGKYNKSTSNVTLSSIGVGNSTGGSGGTPLRINAFEVDVNGNVYIMGIGGYDGMNIGQSGVESVQEVIARLERAIGGNNS